MTDRLTEIEASIAQLSIDQIDFRLLRSRYPELSFFFDRFEDLQDSADDALASIEDLRQALDKQRDEIERAHMALAETVKAISPG